MGYNSIVILPEQEIKTIANKIKALKLETPCMFFLEAHLPISSIFHFLSVGISPVLSSVKGYDTVPNFFSERQNIENLILELENKEAKK